MTMKKYFISKNYASQFGAAGKAKIDCEKALEQIGFSNIGLPRSNNPSSIAGFFLTLASTLLGLFRLPRGSVVVVQYPTKKYYDLIVKVAKAKQCKVISIIHDLRSHRKQKMAVDTEIASLNRNDVIISHNKAMSSWLKERGLASALVELEIFDYLSEGSSAETKVARSADDHALVFAGVLEKRKNGFIYELDKLAPRHFRFNLYGIGFDASELPQHSIIDYQGFFPADQIVNRLQGSFGVVWDGVAVEECKGSFGEYLKINNPHKTSLYLRAGLPVVIWDQAAMAKFVVRNQVGIAVSSLADIDAVLATLTADEYRQMKANAEQISAQLGDGHFIKAAVGKAIELV